MASVGVGIIGCGGRMRTILGKILALTRDVTLVAVCDPLRKSVRATRERFNPQARAYRDYRALVNDPRVDWVMVGSWNCFHAEHTLAAFRAGKHVFCEKPLATSLADCNAMARAWRRSGKMFSIGFTLRYSPHYVAIKRLLDEGTIGYPVSLEFNETLSFNHGGHIMSDWRRLRRFTGSHLLEKCCHDVDLVNWFTGSLAARVASFGGINVFRPENAGFLRRFGRDRHGRRAYRTWEQPAYVNPFTGEHDVVDNQVAVIEYANGVRATFHTNSHSAIPERRMYIIGSEGAIRSDVIGGTLEVARVGFDEPIQDRSAGVRGDHGGGDDVLARSLVASMLEGAPPRTGLEDGLKAAVTCFGIDRAMDTGRTVNMAPLWRAVKPLDEAAPRRHEGGPERRCGGA